MSLLPQGQILLPQGHSDNYPSKLINNLYQLNLGTYFFNHFLYLLIFCSHIPTYMISYNAPALKNSSDKGNIYSIFSILEHFLEFSI